jgi:hypothetical protein
MDILAELENLANGCAASGDKLAVHICMGAIAEIKRLTVVLRDISRGDPFHEHPRDAELRPCDIVMDYAAYRFAAKQALESKGPTP